jgi:hypothetical protein
MKSLTRNITAAAAALITLFASTPESHATKVTLDGSGYYELGTTIKFYGGGVKQTGRYRNLGADYYHKATISMQWITNRTTKQSGSLSFEFWGMPYYGATKGIVLMTRSADPLRGGSYYFEKKWKGYAIFLDDYRFPELNLWEYTSKGWQWRDALSFRQNSLL